MADKLIQIGESIHASIPKTGKVMRKLMEKGPGAYSESSEELDYIRQLIESQADEGADFIAVNLDDLGQDDPQQAVELMKEYVRLVHKWGKSVPVCVDSSDDNILRAGLKTWYETDANAKKPLINSIKTYTMEDMMPLKKDYDFSFIGLLLSEEKSSGPGGSHSVDELFGFARQIFEAATGEYGFEPGDIYFDSTVFPLAIDMPLEPGVPGYTYRTFETIKKIKTDPQMKDCHCSLGISNCARDLPGRRIGICRAYIAKAMEYGLDAAIVNVAHGYGQKDPDPELVETIDAFAKMDGSGEKVGVAMEQMNKLCQDIRQRKK